MDSSRSWYSHRNRASVGGAGQQQGTTGNVSAPTGSVPDGRRRPCQDCDGRTFIAPQDGSSAMFSRFARSAWHPTDRSFEGQTIYLEFSVVEQVELCRKVIEFKCDP